MSAPCAPQPPQALPPGTPAPLLERLQSAPGGEARALALVELARAVRSLSLDAALDLGERALDEALRADSPRAAVLALVGLGFVSANLGQPARALDSVTRAQTLVQDHALSELRAAVINVRALIRVISGNLPGAAHDLHSALELARLNECALDYGHALGNLAWVANLRGDPKDALHHLNLLEEHVHAQTDEPLRASLALSLHENRAHAYVVLAREAGRLGRPEAVQQAAQQGLMVLRAADAALQATPHPSTALLCGAHRAALQRLCGDLDGALSAARAAHALNTELQQRLYLEPLLCLPEVLAARGDVPGALAGYREALDSMRAQGRHRDAQRVLRRIADLHEAQGDLGAALHSAREALAEAQAAQDQISEDAQRHLNVELRQAQADASSWQDRLRHAEVQARQDPLTGVLNRRGLEEGLRTLQDGGGPGWSLLATLFVDIDHFKSVNDRFSHAHGDRVLQAVAGLLAGTVRAGTLLGRYGGEEFVLVAPIRAPGQAHDLAERCRRAIERHDWSALLPGVNLTASVGYAVERPERLDVALQAADDHLYRAKAAGRNRVHPPA